MLDWTAQVTGGREVAADRHVRVNYGASLSPDATAFAHLVDDGDVMGVLVCVDTSNDGVARVAVDGCCCHDGGVPS